jgi:hypothetical protein
MASGRRRSRFAWVANNLLRVEASKANEAVVEMANSFHLGVDETDTEELC